MPVNKEVNKIIKDFLKVNGIGPNEANYLETGLQYGNSVQNALNLKFRKILSIEINKDFIHKATKKFKNEIKNSRVILIEGDSQKKLKEVFNKNINIFFLDAHGFGDTNHKIHNDQNIMPLENEINFLLKRINKNALIIIDDYLKIKNCHMFLNRQNKWISKVSYEKLKKIISLEKLNTFEIFSSDGMASHLFLTFNKKFNVNRYYLKNNINRFLSIKYYYKKKFHIHFIKKILKKIIIFLFLEKFFLFLKNPRK
jgi:hypothetical protein